MKTCPLCAEQIQDEAVKCRHCGGVLALPSGAGGHEDPEVRRLLEAGQKIAAIKRVREQTGLGLKEAKNQVDAMVRQQAADGSRPPPANSPKGGVAAVIAVMLLLALLAWSLGWFGNQK